MPPTSRPATRHSACARQLTSSRRPPGLWLSSYLPSVFWLRLSLLPEDRVTTRFSSVLSRPAPTPVRLSSLPPFPVERPLPLSLLRLLPSKADAEACRQKKVCPAHEREADFFCTLCRASVSRAPRLCGGSGWSRSRSIRRIRDVQVPVL